MSANPHPLDVAAQKAARQLASKDPTEALANNLGTEIVYAKTDVACLTRRLARLDQIQKALAEHGLTVDIDLGPVGNAARAARVTVEEHKTAHTKTFELPR